MKRALWIADQVEKKFGAQGSYLIDFYHACDYFSAASKAIFSDEQGQKTWMDEQKSRLKTDQASAVIQELRDAPIIDTPKKKYRTCPREKEVS